jgi:hypothetical protein
MMQATHKVRAGAAVLAAAALRGNPPAAGAKSGDGDGMQDSAAQIW